MKKFLIKISKVLIVFILVNVCIYFFVFFENNNRYNRCDLKYDSVLMADSHGKSLGNFIESEGVLNFSFESDSYLDIEKKLFFLINNKKDLRKVILTIDDHCFSEYREKTNNIQKSVYFQSLFDENEPVFENFKNKYIKYYFPVFNQNSATLVKMYVASKFNKLRGVKRDTMVWNKLTKEKKNKESYKRLDTQFMNAKYSEKILNSFNRILVMADKNNIEVVLLKFPVSSSYFEAKKAKKIQNPLMIKSKFNRRLVVLDFQDLYFKHDDYFKDPDHLNSKGAKIFSKVLIKSISGSL